MGKYTQLIIRVRAPATTTMVGYRAVDLRYHAGGEHFRARFRVALTLCVRPKHTHVDCPGRTGPTSTG